MNILVSLIIWLYTISTVSSSCVKFKHIQPSDAAYLNVTIFNGTSQETVQIYREGYHRFNTADFTVVSMAQDTDLETIHLTYEEIFPLTNSSVCTSTNALSDEGGCSDGVCCAVTLFAYALIEDHVYVNIRGRVNIRDAEGNHVFWTCHKEFPGWLSDTTAQPLVMGMMTQPLTTTKEPPEDDCYETGVKYLGNDMVNGIHLKETYEECMIKCRNRVGCEFWSYTSSNKQCFLKTSNSVISVHDGAISGPKTCVSCSQNDVKYTGNDMTDGIHVDESPESCQIRCRNTVGCEFWSYLTPDMECRLKHSKTEITTLMAAISGPKTCACSDNDVEFSGSDVDGDTHIEESPETCQVRCRNTVSCGVWTYYTSNSQCNLKHGVIATIAQPGAISGFKTCVCSENDVEYLGTDMVDGIHTEESPETCQVRCRSRVGCNFWTYTTSDNQCNLKNTMTTTSASDGAISGPKTCACSENDVEYTGNNMEHFPIHFEPSPETCQVRCSITDGCEAWTYTTDNSRCTLKQANTVSNPVDGAISGPKLCGEG